MSWEWLQKVSHFISSDAGKFAAGAVSAITFLGAITWRWAKAKVEAGEQRRRADRESEQRAVERQIADMTTAHVNAINEMEEKVRESKRCQAESETERDNLAKEVENLKLRLAAVESSDGKQWEQETQSQVPQFVSAGERKTRFISFLNLKGGVGKTTLTANLGVSLARKNRRVLMVDLDFQGSLTRLCTSSTEQVMEITEKRRTAARLLSSNGDSLPVCDLTYRIAHLNLDGQVCDFIGAGEALGDAESRAQARWLVTKTPDIRFMFRQLFHAKDVFDQYDYVLFDCPPRLTTACINALGCSDFLLIPVLLEQGSVDALPRTLRWLTKLGHVSRARLLGVIANRVEVRAGKAIAAQQTIYAYLKAILKREGYENGVFRAVIRNQRAMIEDAANHGRIAAADETGAKLFEGLTTEIEKGIGR